MIFDAFYNLKLSLLGIKKSRNSIPALLCHNATKLL